MEEQGVRDCGIANGTPHRSEDMLPLVFLPKGHLKGSSGAQDACDEHPVPLRLRLERHGGATGDADGPPSRAEPSGGI